MLPGVRSRRRLAADLETRADDLFAAILDQPGTRLPGERRLKARERIAEEGVAIAPALHQKLEDYARALSLCYCETIPSQDLP